MMIFFFFFNDTATTEIYTLSLHDALPISRLRGRTAAARGPGGRAAAGGLPRRRGGARPAADRAPLLAGRPPRRAGSRGHGRPVLRTRFEARSPPYGVYLSPCVYYATHQSIPSAARFRRS